EKISDEIRLPNKINTENVLDIFNALSIYLDDHDKELLANDLKYSEIDRNSSNLRDSIDVVTLIKCIYC
ncbi:MAG: hypothetical protein MHPSP_000134, partial [Paramarteilia canceri]